MFLLDKVKRLVMQINVLVEQGSDFLLMFFLLSVTIFPSKMKMFRPVLSMSSETLLSLQRLPLLRRKNLEQRLKKKYLY